MNECPKCKEPISKRYQLCPMCGLQLKNDLLKYQVHFLGLCPACGKPVNRKGSGRTAIRFEYPFCGYRCDNPACRVRFLTIKLIVSDPEHYLATAGKFHSADVIEKKLIALGERKVDL